MSRNSRTPVDMSPTILLLVFVLFFCDSPAHSFSFNFSSFDPSENVILYEGDASNFNDSIQLNRVDDIVRVGRATLVKHIHLKDGATRSLSDFTTHFSFTIDVMNSSVYSDGLTFFLSPPSFQLPPNSAGGYLGLCNSTTYNLSSRNRFVAVEFDTYVNEWDPIVQHIGIIVNSLAPVAHVSWNASLHSGQVANAWIHYNATARLLSIVVTYENNPSSSSNYNLSYQVDLMQVLPDWVLVGFTGSTSSVVEKHMVHSWEFSSTLTLKEAGKTTSILKARKFIWEVIMVIVVAVLLGGVGIGSLMVVKRKRRRAMEENVTLTSMNCVFQRGAGPMRFSYEVLASATSNFSDEKKLGHGGFGDVYKGFLIDLDMVVAVKKISRRSKQGKKEYINEVKIFSQLRHRNLVQLVGWCHDRGEFLLVYEFMPNGSLDSHLFGKRSPPLTWAVRYKIATGLASALLYLHEEWDQCVVHRDIKSSNVMLDSGFNTKLGDFGLARLVDHELGAQTTALAGTFGYLAPECVVNGKASKESDVYSFGVVALEIACGRKPLESSEGEPMMRLVEWVWELHENGRLLEAADNRLRTDYDKKQMECLMMVGLWCAQPDPSSRPPIRQVMRVLNMEEAMPVLPNRMPGPMTIYNIPPETVYSNPPSMSSVGSGR
ncbi:L-type lectin-domain-containing protein [Cinnamomum micranthum f. kanehirae]|uniref:non-specific serine/threonine protein kinase n=1 Tax=Cinnamomum micranthum f. kanehirae TaxID=337451 RepID=A0A443NFS9_9MAGN|nr:L-type lectin-domain-containing protein [Cinnamomum micranthum f. kanehirae]